MISKQIPNFITLGNLLCGCLAIYFNDIMLGCWLIVGASVLDFFDGMAARLLQVSSPLGKELDSLADLVSFGLAPALLIANHTEVGLQHMPWIQYLVFALPLGAAWRLARFNVDTEQSVTFKGLPAPANGLFFVGMLAIYQHQNWLDDKAMAPWLLWSCLVLAIIMISKLKLLSFKFKNLNWADNQSQFIVAGSSVIFAFLATIILHEPLAAIPAILTLYIGVSLSHFYILKRS
jgi:CDP-diacylglycerol--serine O-phosphatidyltransferase